MSDYGERLKALRKARYPDFSEDMDMHDITDGISWMADRIEELEAKLAKAVEALVRIADTPSEMTWGVDSEVREAMNGMEIIAETALAELTGGNDE